jgi:hypothetical protein
MSDEKVINLKDYLHKKIEPRNLVSKTQCLEARSENLYKRSFAFALDIFTVGLIKIGVTYTYASFLQFFIADLDFSQKYQLVKALNVMDPLITLSIFFGYFTFCFYALGGKTLGKKLMKLTVITNDYFHEPDKFDFKMSLKQALLRTTGYLASYLSLGILFALPFMRKDNKSLSEIFSKTMVLTDVEFYNHFILTNKTEEVLQVDVEEIRAA